jgi:hypothetical protein
MREDTLAELVAKEEIRELVLLYSRGINRKDFDLLRSLYTHDATDHHGASFFPTPDEFVSRLREAVPSQERGGLYVCNHLIAVNGDAAEGEVYALSYHLLPNDDGWRTEHMLRVRYLDTYRKEDGRWRFAKRTMVVDYHETRPVPLPGGGSARPEEDPSYNVLEGTLFQRGARD